MTASIFVTGTDTGVGKTVVTTALATTWRERGLRVGVMKPAETGCLSDGARLLPQDALALIRASGTSAPLDLVCPYTLPDPLAPALAAERADVHIDPDVILRCFHEIASQHDVVLVEGAGGLLVPLTAELTMLDLARMVEASLLIVARNVLGVINHTALTVAAAHQSGVPLLGVILNEPEPASDLAALTNPASLRRWAGAPLLAEIPYLREADDAALLEVGQMLVTTEPLSTFAAEPNVR